MDEIKVIGKIDLEEYMSGRKLSVSNSDVFKLLQVRCSFYNNEAVLFDFGESLSSEESKGGYFSLLLGKNGACKSSFLRELIEFFIDARGYSKRRKQSHVFIESIKYVIGRHIYQIDCKKNKFSYSRDGHSTNRNYMKYPLIIASTMGMFDKFPVNSKPSYSNGRYNQEYYRYVGPKASNNMFASKANVLLQLMSSLSEIKNSRQQEMLSVILNFIGYDPLLAFRFQVRELSQNQKDPINVNIEEEYRELFNEINDGKQHVINIDFGKSDLRKIKSLPLKSLYTLRQSGLLKNVKCCLCKKEQEVDADYLSSGEFNLLSIVTSVVLAAGHQSLLLLLDEPEISQHPNWQLDLIPNLEKALVDYGCHFLIATHCHFLVSNLPQKRSNVICMTRQDNDVITTEAIPSETYGWSAEEVLLKAFGVPTDRNRYLAEMVSNFLKRIGEKSIEPQEVKTQMAFFFEISRHMSEYDPLKKILDTIVKEFGT